MTYGQLLDRYKKKHGKLVEPNQGFSSLHHSLWLAYSMGRKRGFTDLGTYANKPNSDHNKWPSLAFDLGRNNRFFNLGWDYIVARKLAKLYVEHHEALHINYVILGKKIWSREYPYWHPFKRDTSHMWHMHVSGVG